MSENISYLTDVSLMTCVVKQGMSDTILKAARDVGAVLGAVSCHGRGHGARERLGLLGIAVEAEKEIVSLLVSSEQQDIVFDAMHRAGEMDVPGNGYVYCIPLEKVATFIPKDILDKLEDAN